MKLFNRNPATKLPNTISLGGLPLFSDELVQLESNAFLFGISSILKGWSVILSGCEVDELNTTTKTLTLNAGLVLIDDVVYSIPQLVNQTYPFSIISGTQTIDSRTFQNGEVKDVSIEYNYAIKTSFTFNNVNDVYPSNLTTKEIYFDPFTAQRAEWVLSNKGKGRGSIAMTNKNYSSITKTQTGKNIVGTAISALTTTNFLKWYYFGNSILNYSYIAGTNNPSNAGTQSGRINFSIGLNNTPKHTHEAGGLITSTTGAHTHIIYRNNNYGGDTRFSSDVNTYSDTRFMTYSVANPSTRATVGGALSSDGDHTHIVGGNTGSGLIDSNGNPQLKSTPDPIALNPLCNLVNLIEWTGYNDPTNFNSYKFWNNSTPYLNM